MASFLAVVAPLGGAPDDGGWGWKRPLEGSHVHPMFSSTNMETLGKASDGLMWTEGPVWIDGGLTFTDTIEGSLWRWTEKGGIRRLKQAAGGCPSEDGSVECMEDQLEPGANGLVVNTTEPGGAGTVYACQHGARRVVAMKKNGQVKRVVASMFDGKRLNSPNDLALDYKGGIIFTDPYYGLLEKSREAKGDHLYSDGKSEIGFAGIYYISPGTSTAEGESRPPPEVHLLGKALERPNGVQMGTIHSYGGIWVSECCQGHRKSCPKGTARWHHYELDYPEGGGVPTLGANWTIEQSVGATKGCADGFKVHGPSGSLVSACPQGVCVVATHGGHKSPYNPHPDPEDLFHDGSGGIVEYVSFGKRRVSNVAFGDDGWLYITGEKSLWRLPLSEEGKKWHQEYVKEADRPEPKDEL